MARWQPTATVIRASVAAPHNGWIQLIRGLKVHPRLMEKMRASLAAHPEWERDRAWTEGGKDR